MAIPGLFNPPAKAERPLSRLYTALTYRATPEWKPAYTQIKGPKAGPCDECFANQHELGRDALPRANAKVRRALPGGPVLRLCRGHAEQWRERDEKDGTAK